MAPGNNNKMANRRRGTCSGNPSRVMLMLAVGVLMGLLVLPLLMGSAKRRSKGCGCAGGGSGRETYHCSAKHGREGYAATNNADRFIIFYAEWCGYCKRSMKDFQTLCADANLNAEMKDCSTREAAEAHRVSSFPTIRYYPNYVEQPEVFRAYAGARSVSAMSDYIKQQRKAAASA